jgi:putative hydrolase of the HAD superfamily
VTTAPPHHHAPHDLAPYDVIGFDADDTLWQSEDGFRANELRFVQLLSPYAPDGVDVKAALTAVERKNLHTFGYGVKAFAISMVEAAVTISGGTVPAPVIAELVEMARTQLEEPVHLLPHVPEVLEKVGAHHRLVLITKGDLVHQTHKITTSGLAHHFDHLEVVLEKDPETYAKLLDRFGVEPGRFLMVGNSVRSDILPVMALGGHAVHVPYHLLWDLEHVDHDELFTELSSLSELPAHLGLE